MITFLWLSNNSPYELSTFYKSPKSHFKYVSIWPMGPYKEIFPLHATSCQNCSLFSAKQLSKMVLPFLYPFFHLTTKFLVFAVPLHLMNYSTARQKPLTKTGYIPHANNLKQISFRLTVVARELECWANYLMQTFGLKDIASMPQMMAKDFPFFSSLQVKLMTCHLQQNHSK